MSEQEPILKYCTEPGCGYYRELKFRLCRFHKCVFPPCGNLKREGNYCEGHALALSHITSMKEWWMDLPLDPELPWGKNMGDFVEMQNQGIAAAFQVEEATDPVPASSPSPPSPRGPANKVHYGYHFTSPYENEGPGSGPSGVEHEQAVATLKEQETNSQLEPSLDGLIPLAEFDDRESEEDIVEIDEETYNASQRGKRRKENRLSSGPKRVKGVYDMAPPPRPRYSRRKSESGSDAGERGLAYQLNIGQSSP